MEKNNGISVWVYVTFRRVPIVINYYNRHVIISQRSLQILYVVILSQRFLFFFFLFNLDIGKMRKCLICYFFMPKWGLVESVILKGHNTNESIYGIRKTTRREYKGSDCSKLNNFYISSNPKYNTKAQEPSIETFKTVTQIKFH